MFELNGKYTNAKIMIDNIEPECLAQIASMTNNVAFSNPIAIMPDTHSGKGSVIGFTMKVGDKIIPNIVGVDIGCGMLSFNIGKIELNHVELDRLIREKVPFGFNIREKEHSNTLIGNLMTDEFGDFCKRIGIDFNYALKSVGTLGGGNHFIEIGVDGNDDKWITIHTGSRNLGKKVCEYWQAIATDLSFNVGESVSDGIERIKKEFPKSEWNKEIANLKNNIKMKTYRATGMEYLEGENLKGYISDMYIAQNYAKLNRQTIMNEIWSILRFTTVDFIETVHNYISPDDNIIRKGAIASYEGQRVIIPWNMRDGLIIGEGKSNPEWNFSAPHGAGRVLARGRAKRELDVDVFKSEMVGIFSTSVNSGTLDESPMAYKDSKIIEDAIEPSVKILLKVKPIHNMKASDGGE